MLVNRNFTACQAGSPGEMAADARVDIAELVGTLLRLNIVRQEASATPGS